MTVVIDGTTGIDTGTGSLVAASSATATYLDLFEDTDNGSNYVRLIAPTSVAANRTLTLQDATGKVAYTDTSDNLQMNSGYGSYATAYGCRAWVNFNGTTNVGGFCTVRASGNVTSVADNGTGDYTINFTTAMPDANYSVVAMGQEIAGPSFVVFYISRVASPYLTTSVRIVGINSNGQNSADTAFANVAIFR